MTVPRTTTNSKHTISAVLIVKNEERKLAACLESLDWVDEIIVLDGGSEDRSREIAQAAGARVEVSTDWDGFGVQRCRAEALATCDWILAIDADERVTPELQASIRQAVTQGAAIYEVNRLCWCFGRYIRHSAMHPDWVPRLYPRGQANYDATRVHERLRNPNALPQRRLDGVLLHFVFDSVRHQMQKAAHYAQEWAQERDERGQRGSLASAVTHSMFCFVRMFLLRRGFLDGRPGFLLAMLMSHATFAKYAELWALQRQESMEEPSRHE
jgi:(heptosyl)LPS beta-1,4-glucosyltransferase